MRKIITLLALSLAYTGQAQDTTKTDSLRILGDVIVSVNYMANNHSPFTHQVLYDRDIEPKNTGQEPSFILSETPSMTVYSDAGSYQGYSYFRMRGIDQTRLNLSLDGVPLNEPEDQGVYFSNYPDFFNSIDGMQIQRGVGTSKNGNANYAGGILFVSPRLDDSMKTSFGAGYGSFNTYRAFGEFNMGLKKDVGLYVRASHLHSDGYKYRSANTSNSVFYSSGIVKPKYKLKITGFVGNQKNQMAWLGVPQSAIDIDPRTNANSEEDDNFTQALTMLKYTYEIKDNLRFNASVFYNYLDGNYDFDLNNFLGAPSTDELYNYAFRSNFSGVLSSMSYYTHKLLLISGVHGNMYQRQHTGSELALGELYQNTGFRNEMSAFTKARYEIRHRKNSLYIHGDLQYRYTDFAYEGSVAMDKMQWQFLNPKAGIAYYIRSVSAPKKFDYIELYYSFGRAGREPTRNDLFGGLDDLSADDTGAPLLFISDPEYVNDHELGIRFQADKLKAFFNLYYMDFTNEIVLNGQFGPNGLALNSNVDQSIRTGAELTLSYEVTHWLKLVNNSSYNYSQIQQQGEEFSPILTPPVIINQEAIFAFKGIETGLSFRYQSSSFMDFANDNSLDAYVLLNWRASYQIKGFQLSVFVNNLTNATYYNRGYVDWDGTNKYFIQAPLNFYGMLTYSF